MMLLKALRVALAAILVTAPAAGGSIPKAEVKAETASIGFDPPLDEALRYRWEKTVQRNGQTRMHWSVDDYRFEERGQGYRMTVTPVSWGSNETDPARLAIEKKLAELTRLPFVLRLNEGGEILELERANEFWAGIVKVLRDVVTEKTGVKPTPEATRALEAVIGMYEKIPPEVRLAELTESVQPLVEFAGTETTIGRPISAKVESTSPFGGTLQRDGVISLTKVANGRAHISVRSSIPREELDKLMQALVEGIGKEAMTPADLQKTQAEIRSLKGFKQEARGDYVVSLQDGLLESFQSTETVEISGLDKSERRVTTIVMKRVQ